MTDIADRMLDDLPEPPPRRVVAILANSGIYTIGEALNTRRAALLALDGFGEGALASLTTAIASAYRGSGVKTI